MSGFEKPEDEINRLKDEIKDRDNWIDILINQKQKFLNIINTYQNIIPDPASLLDSTSKVPSAESFEKIYDEYERKIVWVFGTPRSGSTWLSKSILKMDRIGVIDESGIGALFGAYLDDPMPFYHMMKGAYPIRMRRFVDEGSFDAFFSENYEKVWKKSVRNMIIDRIRAQFPLMAFDIIAMKAPNESHGSDIIMKCFSKSKLIFLIRDGRDVIDSRQSKFQNPRLNLGSETEEERKFRINYFSNLWNLHVDVTSRAYESHDPNLRLLVRYEDLRTNPVENIEKIYQFLGFDIPINKIQEISDETKFENVPSFMRGTDKNIRVATPGHWKSYFSEEEKKMANAIMRDNLLKFGYKIE